jgi:hypothetical protein
MSDSRRRTWTLVIVSLGLFMVVLDNLVVTVALPSIHRSLGASTQALEWTVSAYTLSYAVLLLTGAALGDRFGRKRMFIAGIALFTLASAGAALTPSAGLLIAARATQGVGAAIATPLTLTLLADAFPPAQRGLARHLLDQRPRRRRPGPARRTQAPGEPRPCAGAGHHRSGARFSRPVRARLRTRAQSDARLGRHPGARHVGCRHSAARRLRTP